MSEFTPLQRIQIKKDLNDVQKSNYTIIDDKNYDRIIRKTQNKKKGKKKEVVPVEIETVEEDSPDQAQRKGGKIFEQTSFNFNNFSGW